MAGNNCIFVVAFCLVITEKVLKGQFIIVCVFASKERPSPEKWQKLERSRDYRNGNQLREYQLEGMNWLLFNWYNR